MKSNKNKLFPIIITILIIIGGNMNKSEEERKREDEEQIQYIKEYNERKQLKKRSKK